MNLNFKNKGKLQIGMTEYIKESVSMRPEPLNRTVKTPAEEYLLKVNPDAEKLDEKKAKLFHTLTARNLFSAKRARGDTLLVTAFYTTRVKEPDVDD